jgi:hypothetical protein
MSDPQRPADESEIEDGFDPEFDESEDIPSEDASPRPRRGRPVWLMLLVIALCVYAMISLRDDLVYFFADKTPVNLGNAVEFEPGEVPDDTYVLITGIRHPGRGVKLSAVLGDKNIFPFMGTRLAYVETLVSKEKKSENIAESDFTGRLKHFAGLSYFDTFRDFSVQNFGVDVDRKASLIIAHQKPGEQWIIPAIYGLLLIILGLNIILLVRRIVTRGER